MPLGNEPMLVAIRSQLKGLPLTPEALIGKVKGEFQNGKPKVKSVRQEGALASILWGEKNPATKFMRVSMTANDKTDNGSGFLYLSSEIQPTTTQRLVIVFLSFFIGLIAWYICARADGDAFLKKSLSRK
jgi:hypothetical protein